MSEPLKLGAVALACILVGTLIWWFWESPSAGPANTSLNTERSTEEVPDVEATAVNLRQLRPDGSLHYALVAQSIRQFTEEDLTRMAVPLLTLFNPDQPPWDVRAKHGYIRKTEGAAGSKEDVVYLREEVILNQDHPDNGIITMRSEAFYVYPARQYAETDQGVIIDTEVGRTRAAGLKANLDSGLLLLTSNTNAPYNGPSNSNNTTANPQDSNNRTTQRVHTIVLPEQFKKAS